MKKTVMLLACLLTASISWAAAPVGMTVHTSSVKLLPRRGIQSATTWTNGIALSQGQMVKNDGYYYMAEATIASATNEPTHLYGTTNDLRFVPSTLRKACVVQNQSTNNVYLNLDTDAEASKGMLLYPKVALTFQGYQNAFYVLASASNSLVTATIIEE